MPRYLLSAAAALFLSAIAPAYADNDNGFPTDDCDEYGCVMCWEEDADNFMCEHFDWLEIGMGYLFNAQPATDDLTTHWQPPEPPMAPVLVQTTPPPHPARLPRRAR